jgi:sugar lactone lactonase YvrE
MRNARILIAILGIVSLTAGATVASAHRGHDHGDHHGGAAERLFTRGDVQTGTGGFLNDVTVTRRGDVYVTDSFRPTLWHVTAEQVRAGSGTPQALDVSAIPYEGGGAFNVNGIVAKGDRTLVVVDTNSGKLFRIARADRGASILVVNADFGTSRKPFTVAGLPARSRHDHH